MKILIPSAMLLAAITAQATGNQVEGQLFVTVGGDNSCQFQNIQDAIDNGLSNTIRIASNKNYFEVIEIDNVSKNLIGGYANCTDASNNITDLSQAIITGNGSDPVIEVSHTSMTDYEVVLRNLMVANGSLGVYVTAQNSAAAVTKLFNVRSLNNDQGLRVFSFSDGEPTAIAMDSVFDFNDQGVHCSGAGAAVRLGGASRIENNHVTQNGGGIDVRSGCHVDVYSPTVIKDNQADAHGGGVFVSQSSMNVIGAGPFCADGVCMGEYETPVVFEANQADADDSVNGDGGGISAALDANVTIYNAWFKNNQARSGGAIAASQGAAVAALGYQTPAQTCWSPGTCLQFENNSAVWGGALYAKGENTQLGVVAAQFTKQSGSAGVVAFVRTDAAVEIRSSYMVQNGFSGQGSHTDDELLEVFDSNQNTDTVLTLDGVTIADNLLTAQVIKNTSGHVNVYGSLVFDSFDVYVAEGNSPEQHFECVMAHENNSFSAGGTVSVVDLQQQPMFVNPLAVNYHLRIDSPAIDYCYDASGNMTSDADYDDRGSDEVSTPDVHGHYDLGADEFHISNDIIFKDGMD